MDLYVFTSVKWMPIIYNLPDNPPPLLTSLSNVVKKSAKTSKIDSPTLSLHMEYSMKTSYVCLCLCCVVYIIVLFVVVFCVCVYILW